MAIANENIVAESMETKEINEPKSTILLSVLESFTLLSDKDGSAKKKGAANLVTYLSRAKENDNDLQYAVKRLVRSVGSSNANARTSNFSMLVLLLERFQISIAQLLELVKNELHSSSGTKSEVGDVAIGQLLVSGAILRSGLIRKASEDECKEIMEIMFKAASKKVYLNTAAFLFIVDVLPKLNAEEFKNIIWSHIEPHVKKPLDEQTLDSLYFLMEVKEMYPGVVKLKKIIGYENVITEDTVHTICDKLMTISDLSATNHPIYELIGKHIAHSEHLELFWTSGIDSHLVKHNRNREIVAIKLLTAIFNNMTENHTSIPSLLSRNFFNLLIDWFKGLQTVSKMRKKHDDEDEKKNIIKSAKNLFDCLVKALKSDKVTDDTKVQTLNKLLFNPGDMNFSEITSTGIVRTIMADLNKEGVKTMAKLLSNVLMNKSKKNVGAENERMWWNVERLKAAELLSYLVTHPTMSENVPWRLKYMKILLCFGIFKIGSSKENDVAISTELSASIRNSFYRCLNSKMPTAEGLVNILKNLCDFIEQNLSDKDILKKLEKQVSQESRNCWKTLRKVVKTIESHSENEKRGKIENVFLILLYQLGLFLFAEPKYVKMAQESIKELKSCYEHYKDETKNIKKEAFKEGEIYEGEPEWIEVLVEVLLSILSHDSSVLRSIVQCVFRLLWEYLTPSSIGQILSVLDPQTDSNPLEEGNSDDSDRDSEDSDADTLGIMEKSVAKDKDEDESESEDDSDVEDVSEASDDDDMTVTDQLRLAVQKALGNAATDTDTESVDADMIDEDEGKKLDKALSEAFKILGKGKKENEKKERKDKKTLTDFRIRVIDLIDIYLEKEPSLDICLGMITPLMHCVEYCVQENGLRDLENRVRKTLKNLMKIRKFSSMDDVTLELLCDNLKATVEKGDRSHFVFQAVGDLVTEFGTFIVQCSQKILQSQTKKKDKSNTGGCLLTKYYKDSLVSFFVNRNCSFPIIFFHKILQIDWIGNFSLLPIIIEHAFNPAVRQFKRQEALEMLIVYYINIKRIRPDNVVAKLKPVEKQLQDRIGQSLSEKNEEFVVKDKFFQLLKKLQKAICNFYESISEKTFLNMDVMTNDIVSAKEGMKQKRSKQDNVTTKEIAKSVEVNGIDKKKKNVRKNKHNGIQSQEPQQKKIKL